MSFINILFIQDGEPINMQAKTDMMFAEVVFKFCLKYNINLEREKPIFIYNSIDLVPDTYKKLDELGIYNGSRIEVIIGNDI